MDTQNKTQRVIKFRAWDGKEWYQPIYVGGGWLGRWRIDEKEHPIVQYTGLKDKSGVAEIYEGDIIDSEGNIIGNIYESPQIHQGGANHIIANMGTKEWRDTEHVAMGCGCKYAE